MIINFSVNSPPFSVNKAYYRNRQRTQECRKWSDNILTQLQHPSIQAQFQALRDATQPNDTLTLHITHVMPEKKFRTKKGTISRFSMDLSNIEKLPIDLVFDDRFDGRFIDGTEIRNLCLDDKIITTLISKKQGGDDYKINFTIALN